MTLKAGDRTQPVSRSEHERRYEIGTRLKRAREVAGVTIAEVAAATGVPKSSVYEREAVDYADQVRGRTRPVTRAYLEAVAAVTGADPDWLESGQGCTHAWLRLQARPGFYACLLCLRTFELEVG